MMRLRLLGHEHLFLRGEFLIEEDARGLALILVLLLDRNFLRVDADVGAAGIGLT